MDTWHNINCEKCQTKNWINQGDLEDLTIPDVEAFECWKCHHKQWLADEAWIRVCYGENADINDVYIELGLEHP